MRHLLETNVWHSAYRREDLWYWEIVHIIVIGLLFIPISLYGIERYYKLRLKIEIKKRSARIVLLTGILIIFELLRRIWVFTYLLISTYKSINLCFSCLYMIEVIIYPLFCHGLMYSILWRFFVIYYKSNWTQSIIKDENVSLSKKDWFITYKSTIGNVEYNGKIFLFLYLTSFLTSTILFQFSIFSSMSIIIAFVIDSCLLITPSICMIYLYIKTPTINDHFCIRYEMRIIAKITMFGLSAYSIITIFIPFLNIHRIHYYGMISLIGSIQYVSYNITSLYFMIYKLKENNILSIDNKIPQIEQHPVLNIRNRIRTVSDINEVATIIQLNDIGKYKPNQLDFASKLQDPQINEKHTYNESIRNSYPSINSINSADINIDPEIIDNNNNKHKDDEIIIITENKEIIIDDEQQQTETIIVYNEKINKNDTENRFNKTNLGKINYHILLKQILSKRRSYEAFIIHLSKEYSMECIFAFTEFLQFKQYLEMDELFINEVNKTEVIQTMNAKNNIFDNNNNNKQNRSLSVTDLLNDMSSANASNHSLSYHHHHNQSLNNNNNNNHNDIRDIICSVDLPLNIPKSRIVYMFEDNDHNEYDIKIDEYLKNKRKNIRIIIKKLCEKYIFGKGDFQINISYSIKSEFDLLIDTDNNDKWINNESLTCYQLYTIFDQCITEMFQLMTHSSRRFIKTKEYQKIKEIVKL